MWISPKHFTYLTQMQEDLASARAEASASSSQIASLQTSLDWLRVRMNALELERTILIKKAFNIDIPTPEIARRAPPIPSDLSSFSFDDIGDEAAKKLGLPIYGN